MWGARECILQTSNCRKTSWPNAPNVTFRNPSPCLHQGHASHRLLPANGKAGQGSGWSIPMRHSVPLMSNFGSRTPQRPCLRCFHPRFLPSPLSLWVRPVLLSDGFCGVLWLPAHFFSQVGGSLFNSSCLCLVGVPPALDSPSCCRHWSLVSRGRKKDSQPLVTPGKV